MNGYNFTDRVRKVLQMAREEAARLKHEYVGTEHILLGLAREGEGVAAAALVNLSVDLEQVIAAIDDTVIEGRASNKGQDVPYTSRAKKILEFSTSAARELNHSYLGTEHLLLGVLREDKGIGARTLHEFGVTFETVRAEILRLLGSEPREASGENVPDIVAQRFPALLDRAFKTAIAFIELHHRRTGTYPNSLQDLEYSEPYDTALLSRVRYEKLSDGYALDVKAKGAKPGLSYPPGFWRGLGIRRTNVEGFNQQ
jgi:ATP-dependent Clp protease ATP-binding subunit ClpA